ncbi:MAG: universal stress protein [Vicinamibacterales bacterium]
MTSIRTILCPVDFSAATQRQVEFGVGLARLFGARLVLHHNESVLSAGAAVGWMYATDHATAPRESVGSKLDALTAYTRGIETDLRMTEGPASVAVLAVAEAEQADLIILSTHHATTDDHTSLTETIVNRGHRTVLVLHEASQEPGTLQFERDQTEVPQIALVPTDLTPESRAAVRFAFGLARVLPIHILLVHFLKHGGIDNEALACDALRVMIPEDLLARTLIDVREDEPAHGIMQMASDLHAACIIMGEHTRSPLRRWLTRDTSHAVLHQAHCPVWYVPGEAMAA